MKRQKMLKRGLCVLLALLMIGAVLVSAMPVHATNTESEENQQQNSSNSSIINYQGANLRRVANYPLITFYDEDGKQIPELTGILAGRDDLKYDSSEISYQVTNAEGKKETKTVSYSKVDLVFAYADMNYPLIKNGVDSFKNMPDDEYAYSYIHYGEEEIEADSVSFTKTQNNYLMAKIGFYGVDLFDDYNDEIQLYLQYQTKDANTGALSNMTRGNADYKFSKLETPIRDEEQAEQEEDDKQDGTHFGDPELGEGEEEEEIIIASSTPYIIVEEFDFAGGSTQVAAGSSFNLNLVCTNTHRSIDLENIIMKVTATDGLQLTSSSNTFYVNRLKRKDSFEKELDISVLANAEAKSHTITVSFQYEYVADDARQKGEMSQDITIPVVQQDRFSADPITEVREMTVGEEIDILSKYMNKSRGELFNLTATLECEESILCEEKILHKGNILAGGSGEMEFSLSGTVPGTYDCTIIYTYEDSVGIVKETRVPFQVTFVEAPVYEWDQPVMEEIPMDDMMYDEFGNPIDPMAAEEGLSQNQKIMIGAGAVIVVIAAALIIRKRKKAKEFEDDDENF